MPSTIDPTDISSYCIGTPERIATSSSGGISLSLSLQEEIVFLACPTSSPSSYSELDGDPIPHMFEGDDAPSENDQEHPQPSVKSTTQSSKYKKISPRQSLIISSLDPLSSPSDLPPSILRGSLFMKLTKPTKIKNISLRFYGKCKTNWLNSNINPDTDDPSLPSGPQFQDELIISSHTWEYVPTPTQASTKSSIVTMDATSVVSTDLYGADVAYIPNDSVEPSKRDKNSGKVNFKSPSPNSGSNLHLNPTISNLSQNDIPFFTPTYFDESKTDVIGKLGPLASSFAANSHSKATVYPAGQYVFHFTLALDARTSETVIGANGSIRYFLVAKVTRPSRLSFNIAGCKEIELVRSPPNVGDVCSQNPLSISRDWADRLHYEINCPQSYIPLGSSVPLSIKLTPLDKIQVQRVKVHLVETVTYISSWISQIRHQEPAHKILCYYKCAKLDSTSSKTLPDHIRKRKKKRGVSAGNLLNFADVDVDACTESGDTQNNFARTTELNATMPFIESHINLDTREILHSIPPESSIFNTLRPDAIYNPLIHIKHRLHISFRIAKKDPDEVDWKYFEVLIDVPIHVLSRHCNGENAQLPQYIDHNAPTSAYTEPNPFGSPIIRVDSDPLSSSFEDTSNGYIPLDRAGPTSGTLPSFGDALHDQLYSTEEDDEIRRLSVGSAMTGISSSSDMDAVSENYPDIEDLNDPPQYDTIVDSCVSPLLRVSTID